MMGSGDGVSPFEGKSLSKGAVKGLALCMFVSSLSWMVMRYPEQYIQTDYGGDGALILSLYIVAEVTVLPLAGKLIDMYGPRRMLSYGVPIFVAGSIACPLAGDMSSIILFRAIQGVGAGIVFAICLSSVGILAPRSQRIRPHKSMTAAFSFGSLYGSALGYWLNGVLGWEAIFIVSAVLMVVGGYVAYKNLPDGASGVIPDMFGSILVTLLVLDLMLFSQLVNGYFPLVGTETLAMLLSAVVLVCLLAVRIRGSGDPVIPRIRLMHGGPFLCMFLVGFCGLGMVQFMMMFMLLGMGTDIYIASAMYLFMTIGGSITSKFCLKRLYSTGLKPFLFMGPLILAVGFLLASRMMVFGLPAIALCLFVVGMGIGCMVTEILLSVQGTTPRSKMGSSTSLTMSTRFVGILLGGVTYKVIVVNRLESEAVRVLGEGGATVDIGWVVEHYDLFHDTLIQLFESSVQYCCGIAAVMSLVILVAAYFFTDRSDVDAPEFVDE